MRNVGLIGPSQGIAQGIAQGILRGMAPWMALVLVGALGCVDFAAGTHAPANPLDGGPTGYTDAAARPDVPLVCPSPTGLCGGRCVDLRSDLDNCGRCAFSCGTLGVCYLGRCVPFCDAGAMQCNGRCINVQSDPVNCGGCGTTCGTSTTCTAGVCTHTLSQRQPLFRISALTATGCATTAHGAVTGTDHGGLVVGADGAYYTGDRATGVFALGGLTVVRTLPPMAALVSNIHDGTVYTLANGTEPVGDGGGTVTALVTVSPSRTGPLLGAVLPLSRTLLLGPGTGIFSGWDIVVLHTGTEVYAIDLATGQVSDLGAMPAPAHQSCGAWAYWGLAEFYDNALVLDYVRDRTTIARLRLSDGATQALATFTDLGDLCGIGLSADARQWYWHTHAASQFGPAGETLGRCPATWDSPSETDRYTREDSSTPGADWVDACAAPGHETVLPNVDDGSILRPLPFAFRYWDVSRPAGAPVNISSNGWLGLDGVSNVALTGHIPIGAPSPRSVVALHWGDLVTRTQGVCVATVGDAPARRWVAEWADAFYCCGDNRDEHLTFEAIVEESTGAIELVYQTLTNGRPMTVGIENGDNTDWVGVCNSGSPCGVTAGTAIRFHR